MNKKKVTQVTTQTIERWIISRQSPNGEVEHCETTSTDPQSSRIGKACTVCGQTSRQVLIQTEGDNIHETQTIGNQLLIVSDSSLPQVASLLTKPQENENERDAQIP